MKKKILILIGIFIFFGIVFISNQNLKYKTPLTDVIQKASESSILQPSPYEEITIPYLRKKEYKSKLGELKEVAQHPNYTSHLTSYISDRLKINGLLTKPTGPIPEGGFPAIVFVHGYIAPTTYITLEKYEDYVDYLAQNGFVVFKIDLRGHGDSEGEPGGGYFWADYVTDTLNAHSALETSGFVNKKNIGLWGHSMAGNTVMRSMAVKPTIPAVVGWAGAVYTYTDQREYEINDQSYRPAQARTGTRNNRQEMFNTVGSPSAESAFWKSVAPTSFLNDIKGAIQIHHAKDDTVVDIRYSRNLMSYLDKTSIPHELFEYDYGGHNIIDSSFSIAMQRTVEFYKKYLNN